MNQTSYQCWLTSAQKITELENSTFYGKMQNLNDKYLELDEKPKRNKKSLYNWSKLCREIIVDWCYLHADWYLFFLYILLFIPGLLSKKISVTNSNKKEKKKRFFRERYEWNGTFIFLVRVYIIDHASYVIKVRNRSQNWC